MRDVSAADLSRLRLKVDRAIRLASFLEVAQVVKTARHPENCTKTTRRPATALKIGEIIHPAIRRAIDAG
jgi:hypothetical protein